MTTPKSDTQNADVLWHLYNRDSITSMEAFSEYNITRLSARIYDLRRMGYAIEGKPASRKNARGKTVHWTEYRLRPTGG